MNKLFSSAGIKLLCALSLITSGLLFSGCETLQQTSGAIIGGLVNGAATGPLGAGEVSQGLKEALSVGIKEAVFSVNKKDGYLGNPLVKIPFPPEALKVEKTLRSLGLNSLCDNFVTSLNRGAEDASAQALNLFTGAITSMSIKDAMSILSGPQNAATQYLKAQTQTKLESAYKPILSSALDKSSATKYWAEMASQYNRIPLVKPMQADLTSYATDKALTGLFSLVAQKEADIRENPVARTSALLKRVFSGTGS